MDVVDDRLRRWLGRYQRVFALTGAGCSTASGIPDYRDDQGAWTRRPPDVWAERNSKAARRIPRELWPVAHRKLTMLDGAQRLDDLAQCPATVSKPWRETGRVSTAFA